MADSSRCPQRQRLDDRLLVVPTKTFLPFVHPQTNEGNHEQISMKMPQPVMVIVFVALPTLFAQALAQEAPGSRGADEQTIRSLEDQERRAILNRDLDALKRLWSEHLLVNAPGNTVSPNRDVPLGLVQAGMIHYTSFERSIEALRIDGDTAFVMGAETIQPTGKAPLAGQTVQRRFTHVWKKAGETWRLAARHANILPPE